jgi:hypothetical protein
MFNVPLDPLVAADCSELAAFDIFPTIDAEFGDAKLKVTQEALAPQITFAVRITPLLKAKFPPAVAPPVLSFLTSATVVFTLRVTVKLFDISVSALVNDGNRSLAVPPCVVAHTSVAFTLPALRA